MGITTHSPTWRGYLYFFGPLLSVEQNLTSCRKGKKSIQAESVNLLSGFTRMQKRMAVSNIRVVTQKKTDKFKALVYAAR